jgi:hypothetical protein
MELAAQSGDLGNPLFENAARRIDLCQGQAYFLNLLGGMEAREVFRYFSINSTCGLTDKHTGE